MSRIGKKVIEIPQGVSVDVNDGLVTVKGPKGEDKQQLDPRFEVKQENNELTIICPSNSKKDNAFHGLYRSLVYNMVEGVVNGYQKVLKIEGTGYRANKQGKKLVMNLGFSHNVEMTDPEGIETETPDDRTIIVKGINKQLVGGYAAKIRDWRKPEPYKGKGIKYEGEHIRRKVGKTGK
ncbi:MAG: 50S ribosomal protein L6 [Tissierellia bacterium]|nr:50S ribosomal protein L6 [Tissierellia bacterium]